MLLQSVQRNNAIRVALIISGRGADEVVQIAYEEGAWAVGALGLDGQKLGTVVALGFGGGSFRCRSLGRRGSRRGGGSGRDRSRSFAACQYQQSYDSELRHENIFPHFDAPIPICHFSLR